MLELSTQTGVPGWKTNQMVFGNKKTKAKTYASIPMKGLFESVGVDISESIYHMRVHLWADPVPHVVCGTPIVGFLWRRWGLGPFARR